MATPNGDVRERVMREARAEIRRLADEGMSAEEIDRSLNGRRSLTEAEHGLIEFLIHHAVSEAKGYYSPVQFERGGIRVTLDLSA